MGTRHLEIAGLPEVYEYIVINPTDAGMFLVNYDPHNWNLLKRDFSQLPVRTRAKLMNDVLLLVRGGEQDYVLALNLTLNLFDETDCSVWTPLFKHLSNIEPLYSFTPVEEKLNAYLRLLLTHRFDAMVQPDFESDNDYRNCWNQAKEQLYKLGYQPHVDKARERLQEIMPIFLVNDTNSGMVVFCPEFMRNDSEDWLARNTELHYFLDSQRETKPFLERSLAKCPGYSSLVERVLNQTLDDNTVLTTTDWYGILNFISSSSEAQNISLEFFFENYNQLKYKFYFMEEYWKSLVTRVTDNIRTEETLSKLNQLCKEHEGKLGYTQSVFEEAIKKATKTIEWCRSNLPDINIWLEDVLPRAGVM
ncbi:aminopeptidase N-like [Periplaneta americana]|uniref:aminopeptidase N-like n=1 Tax=Periplaneta americana TaxID=6978 RepID=UPI0037E90D31